MGCLARTQAQNSLLKSLSNEVVPIKYKCIHKPGPFYVETINTLLRGPWISIRANISKPVQTSVIAKGSQRVQANHTSHCLHRAGDVGKFCLPKLFYYLKSFYLVMESKVILLGVWSLVELHQQTRGWYTHTQTKREKERERHNTQITKPKHPSPFIYLSYCDYSHL